MFPFFSFSSDRRGERCVTGLEECKGITARYHSLVSPLYISCFCLSGCCFEAFPWEQWSRAGRCCCPWCRNSQTWWGCNTRRFFVIWASAACKHCQAVIIKTCVAHIQNDKFSSTPTASHVNTHIDAGVDSQCYCPPSRLCLNDFTIMRNVNCASFAVSVSHLWNMSNTSSRIS